jgi:[CysO sulfur-carrier protein]-S-L-cysteine hydrolase
VVIFPTQLRQQLIDHATAETPDEVCGILAGHDDRIERVFPVRNTADEVGSERAVFRERESGAAAPGRKAVHYYMDPRDQLRVYNEIDDLRLDLIGYYHSHTHTEARPSPTDIRLATDLAACYILIGLQDQPPVVRAWRIQKADPMAETGELVELEITD